MCNTIGVNNRQPYLPGLYQTFEGVPTFLMDFIFYPSILPVSSASQTGRKIQDIAQVIGYNNTKLLPLFQEVLQDDTRAIPRKYCMNIPDDDIEDPAIAEIS